MFELNKFEDLQGKTLTNIENLNNEELVFTLDNGQKCKLYHDQDCCESVTIEDIIGDITDLVGTPLLLVEEVTSEGVNPEDVDKRNQDSFTWTFYKMATVKGFATIRWYGESNEYGYYSELVDFTTI